MRDEGLNHSSHSKQDVRHFRPTPKLPWSQGGDAKGFRGISGTLGLLGSLGTLSLGNARLLQQPCFLPFRAASPYPSRLLTADTILGDDPRKRSRGLAFFAGTRAQGPWWVSTPKSSPDTFMCLISNTSCHLLGITRAKHSVHPLWGLICSV